VQLITPRRLFDLILDQHEGTPEQLRDEECSPLSDRVVSERDDDVRRRQDHPGRGDRSQTAPPPKTAAAPVRGDRDAYDLKAVPDRACRPTPAGVRDQKHDVTMVGQRAGECECNRIEVAMPGTDG
jgi:hypothetical protein